MIYEIPENHIEAGLQHQLTDHRPDAIIPETAGQAEPDSPVRLSGCNSSHDVLLLVTGRISIAAIPAGASLSRMAQARLSTRAMPV
jgi:hypothetical protein